MLALPELQRAFAAAILTEEATPLAGIVKANGIAAERRIQVYRNNSLITLGEALKATFPVVCRLVDERFFDYAARSFIRAHPPRQPRLAEYGDGFADFIGGFAPAQSLPYLADVARLEWAINVALSRAGPRAAAAGDDRRDSGRGLSRADLRPRPGLRRAALALSGRRAVAGQPAGSRRQAASRSVPANAACWSIASMTTSGCSVFPPASMR